MDAIPSGASRATLIIGGDGRFYNKEVMQIIAEVAAGNGVIQLYAMDLTVGLQTRVWATWDSVNTSDVSYNSQAQGDRRYFVDSIA